MKKQSADTRTENEHGAAPKRSQLGPPPFCTAPAPWAQPGSLGGRGRAPPPGVSFPVETAPLLKLWPLSVLTRYSGRGGAIGLGGGPGRMKGTSHRLLPASSSSSGEVAALGTSIAVPTGAGGLRESGPCCGLANLNRTEQRQYPGLFFHPISHLVRNLGRRGALEWTSSWCPLGKGWLERAFTSDDHLEATGKCSGCWSILH